MTWSGDSALISTPGGKIVLIDGGPWGKEVEGFLASRGINKPDLYIVSHGDSDHITGLIWLMKTKAPKNILLPANSRSNELLEELLLLGKEKNTNIIFGYTGKSFKLTYGVEYCLQERNRVYNRKSFLSIMVRYRNRSLLSQEMLKKMCLKTSPGGTILM